ncbi:MAG: molybdenum cofactor biosynthesis protein MoaE [Gemmatimonadaceae bacterium]
MRSALVNSAIDLSALLLEVSSDSCGASTLFVGTVRNMNDGRQVSGIEYTAYDSMAEAEMHRIVSEAGARFETDRIAMEHRLGYLGLGEASVAIAVAHPRRTPALDASRFIIEELKRRVPIWKREHYVDGTRDWVDPTRTSAEAGR